MPCYDPREHETEAEMNGRGSLSHAQLSAALCGVLSLDDKVLDAVDWPECGVPKALVIKWWRKHQSDDRKRHASTHNPEKEE